MDKFGQSVSNHLFNSTIDESHILKARRTVFWHFTEKSPLNLCYSRNFLLGFFLCYGNHRIIDCLYIKKITFKKLLGINERKLKRRGAKCRVER